jgi:hypothetical protein
MARCSGFLWVPIKHRRMRVNATQITMLLERLLAAQKRVKKHRQNRVKCLILLVLFDGLWHKKRQRFVPKDLTREVAMTMGLALALDAENEGIRATIMAEQFALDLQEVAN